MLGYFWGRNKFGESANRIDTRIWRRFPETRLTRTLLNREARRGGEDYERVERPSTARREQAEQRFTASSGARQNLDMGAERKILRLQEQVDELTRQLKNAQQPPDKEVARLRQEIADLTILVSDAKSPQNAELAYLRQQVNELTRQLQSQEDENDSNISDESV